ncbi:MAG: biotin--[acetyl-CoA-carboxylase] ligase [Rhizobiaceae bacterium]|nr:biotin--[acetyl-CoA-carboxylase] ligase [Rhizobiaceae bacterium]
MSISREFRHVALGDVQSTNTECMDRARAGDPGNLWITATRQLGGRARRGRHWVSEPGNLYASLLLIDPASAGALATLPLAVAVAVHSAISRVLPQGAARPTIKWPNDVLVDGAKISGILLESENLPDGRRAVVIGCGINVMHAPKETNYPAVTLRETGATVSAEELFARLYQAMDEELKRWNRGLGIASVRQAWLNHAKGIGKAITVNLPDHSISGVFTDIDQTGCLVMVDHDNKTHTIAAGDVFFR